VLIVVEQRVQKIGHFMHFAMQLVMQISTSIIATLDDIYLLMHYLNSASIDLHGLVTTFIDIFALRIHHFC